MSVGTAVTCACGSGYLDVEYASRSAPQYHVRRPGYLSLQPCTVSAACVCRSLAYTHLVPGYPRQGSAHRTQMKAQARPRTQARTRRQSTAPAPPDSSTSTSTSRRQPWVWWTESVRRPLRSHRCAASRARELEITLTPSPHRRLPLLFPDFFGGRVGARFRCPSADRGAGSRAGT